MYFFLLLALSVLPGILLLWYFYEKDILEKEPRRVVFYAFLLGIFAIIPAIIFEFLFGAALPTNATSQLTYSFYEAFIGVALIEESIKYIIVRFWALRRREFTELYDGIVYATAISLGFATLENILYVFQGGVGIALIRAFFTVPMHAFGSVMIGYYLAKYKFKIKNERFLLFKGLALPILLHGSFNFVLMSGHPFWTLSLFPIMGIYIYVVGKIFRQLRAEQKTITSAIPHDMPMPSLKDIARRGEIGEPQQSRHANNLLWMIGFLVLFGIAASIVAVVMTTFLH